MSQVEMLLAALREGRAITPADALVEFGTFRLAARVIECRQRLDPDEELVSETVTAPSGKRVARYSLQRVGQAKLWPDRKRPPVIADATVGMVRADGFGPRRGL